MKYKAKSGEIKEYYYPWLQDVKEKKYWLYLPFDGEWHKMPVNIYESKSYPTCPKCRDKFVPIKDYKRCFKCRFLDNIK